MQPLHGIRILDFSTLLPGPLASLLLAEAGAEVIKIERPGGGDEMRSYEPKHGSDSVNFGMLNRGKRSLAIDLKEAGALERLRPLIETADVVLEQFRPGVMDRLGFGYDALRRLNPRIIYCSITGYGQQGPLAGDAGHDLNYQARTGLLSLAADRMGNPVVPAALIGDIAGGSYPAVINILLALRERDRTAAGCKLDIAMAENLFTLMYWAIGNGLAAGQWPGPGSELVTGGSPRYNIYRTADDRFLAAAPLEQKFWDRFCELLGVPAAQRDDSIDAAASQAAVTEQVRTRTSDALRQLFAGQDVCCCVVATVEEAIEHGHFAGRAVFAQQLASKERSIGALPVPIAQAFRSSQRISGYPALGEANEEFLDSSGPES